MDDVQTGSRPPSLASVIEAVCGPEHATGEPDATPGAVLRRWAEAVRALRAPLAGEFHDEIRRLAARLCDRLEVDAARDPDDDAADRLAGELGGAAGAHLDAAALAGLLPQHGGPARLGPDRRRRIDGVLAALERALQTEPTRSTSLVVHDGAWPESLAIDGLEPVEADDPVARAIELFDEQASHAVELLRAVRVARLELVDQYDPARHDPALARLDWRAASGDERRLLPAIAVLDRGDRVRRRGAVALAALFTARRPIRLLLLDPALGPAPGALGDPWIDLPTVAVAYRELHVIQTTPACPSHLSAGLERLAASPDAGVALIALPSGRAGVSPATELAAAHAGRAMPCLTYDPAAGDGWVARLELGSNPQPESAWPVHGVEIPDDAGETSSRDEAFTFAHAVAIHPEYASEFESIDADAWSEAQVELAEYLATPAQELVGATPYILLQDSQGGLRRALVAPSLVAACRERAQSWRMWRELAGVDNQHLRRAVEAARGELEADAWRERRELAETHEAELARVQQAAGQAGFERMLNALIDGTLPTGPAAGPGPEGGNGAGLPTAIAVDVPAGATAAAPEATSAMIVEPMIDSVLCTTCNECTNLNPRMFRYNADKQAEIADASAGTFAELVKAAERCPARCIHPGVPRPGDSTATAALIGRAEPFN